MGVRYGGRSKGTPNKRTQQADEICEKLGINPIELLGFYAAGKWKELGYESEVYHHEKPDGSIKMGYVISPEMRLKAISELCQYVHPKKKSVEVSGGDNAIKIVIEDYSKK